MTVALIQLRPRIGEQLPTHGRVTWLRMIAMALQVSYGAGKLIKIKKRQC